MERGDYMRSLSSFPISRELWFLIMWTFKTKLREKIIIIINESRLEWMNELCLENDICEGCVFCCWEFLFFSWNDMWPCVLLERSLRIREELPGSCPCFSIVPQSGRHSTDQWKFCCLPPSLPSPWQRPVREGAFCILRWWGNHYNKRCIEIRCL